MARAGGGITAFLRDAIHGMVKPSASIHVYGRHVNHTARYAFDPEQRQATP